jgi:hypothetical protein
MYNEIYWWLALGNGVIGNFTVLPFVCVVWLGRGNEGCGFSDSFFLAEGNGTLRVFDDLMTTDY